MTNPAETVDGAASDCLTGERIIAAAIRHGEMIISAPPPARHHNLIHALYEASGKRTSPDDQGFLTSTGRFVCRKLGLRIADREMQIVEKTGNPFQLFSEDLW